MYRIIVVSLVLLLMSFAPHQAMASNVAAHVNQAKLAGTALQPNSNGSLLVGITADQISEGATKITIYDWLQKGGIMPARADSSICNDQHQNYSATDTWLSNRGLSNSNILCGEFQ